MISLGREAPANQSDGRGRQAVLAQGVARVRVMPPDSEKKQLRGRQIQSHVRIGLCRNALGVGCGGGGDRRDPGDSDRRVRVLGEQVLRTTEG